MINRPPERELTILDSKYSLVVAVAKRARQLINRRDPGVVFAHKPVITALQEITEGRIRVVSRPEVKPETPDKSVTEAPPAPVAGEAEEKSQ